MPQHSLYHRLSEDEAKVSVFFFNFYKNKTSFLIKIFVVYLKNFNLYLFFIYFDEFQFRLKVVDDITA